MTRRYSRRSLSGATSADGPTHAPRHASLWLAWLVALLLLAGCATPAQVADPLPSWNEGPAKAAIVKLVQDTTWPGSPDFVPLPERIATFDNDGTLWCEHPMYVEVVFTFERIKEHGGAESAVAHEMPYKAVIDNDEAAMASSTGRDYFQLVAATHAGRRRRRCRRPWPTGSPSAKHPRFNRPYTDLVYQPMLEVLAYFRANGYKTFIVSGGTLDFVRAFAEKAYGIPPEQVVGTSFAGARTRSPTTWRSRAASRASC